MRSLKEIAENYHRSTLDGRDMMRILQFMPADLAEKMGYRLRPEFAEPHQAVPFTRENVLENLKRDLALAFEASLEQDLLASCTMFYVVKMWNWILDEGIPDMSSKESIYLGLPLFKMTALKYGFENMIGDDTGTEKKYAPTLAGLLA